MWARLGRGGSYIRIFLKTQKALINISIIWTNPIYSQKWLLIITWVFLFLLSSIPFCCCFAFNKASIFSLFCNYEFSKSNKLTLKQQTYHMLLSWTNTNNLKKSGILISEKLISYLALYGITNHAHTRSICRKVMRIFIVLIEQQ